jgi:superfamily II DNA or RNA helicase
VLGDNAAPELGPHVDVRRVAGGPVPLSIGLAFSSGDDGWAAIIGNTTGELVALRWLTLSSAEPGDVAIQARGLFEFLWPQATDAGPQPTLLIGSTVRRLGDDLRWTVTAHLRRTEEGSWIVRISRDDQVVDIEETGLVEIDVNQEGPEGWVSGDTGNASDFALVAAFVKLANPLTDTVYSYLSTKTVFRSYQFRPLLRLLESPHQRLLIADEVGLGKTIEAGLIWMELDQRSEVNRALVVCPAVLVNKWHEELRRRFDRELRVLDRRSLPELVYLAETDDPRPFHAVVSLESLRSAPELEQLSSLAPRFDLVIVDEAHYLRNSGTRSHALGELLSDWADVLLFLSATPLNLGQEDLFSLLNLLVEEEFSDGTVFIEQMAPNLYLNALGKQLLRQGESPQQLLSYLEEMKQTRFGAITARKPEFALLHDLFEQPHPLDARQIAEARRHLAELNSLSSVVSRTRKVETNEPKIVREAWSIDVEWRPEELGLYQAVNAWARERALQSSGVVGFATQMPLRQAASCLPALCAQLQERHPSLRASDDDFDDFDDAEAFESDETVDESELTLRLSAAMSALGDVDTKFDKFASELQRLRGAGVVQVMVFSFFRRTLGYLAARLTKQGESVRIMDGSVRMNDRIRIMADFRAGKFDILLLSEVGSEGLDFEFCEALVNYDLPWNPMRVEQRIGRLDRFGSPHEKIFIINFHVPGTIETDIFERLYRRIGVFEASIGELEPILRDEINELTRVALDPRLNDQQRQAELLRIETAVETRRQDLKDISEAEASLTGIDAVLIDGFARATEQEGRFVGRTEIRRLLDELFVGTGARFVQPRNGHLELRGTAELRDKVISTGVSGGASLYPLGTLLVRLSDEMPIPVTFDNEEAARTGVELLSLRHPLVIAAVHLTKTAVLRRFATLRVPHAPAGEYFAGLWLLQATGLRPALELWSIAVDLETGQIVDDVGRAVLRACANGDLLDGGPPPPIEQMREALHLAEAELDRRRHREEKERHQANEVLIDSRLRARRDGTELKIRSARNTMAKVTDPGIIRLYQGRIRNLELQAARIESGLDARRGLVMSSEAVAVALVNGC